MEKEARADQNWRRQEQANKRKRKPTTAFRSYKHKQLKSVLARLGKWEAARKHLAPFVAESTTEGLVMSPDGIDMSVDGDQWVLRKATLVHLYVSSRLLGLSRDIATEITCATFPESERMHSGRTLRRYLAENFELGGFRETKRGKWVRENIFGNAALMFAMKTWLTQNEYKIIVSKDDPEDRKCFIAKHAADHLNGLLDAHPEFKSDKTYAASTPIKEGVMRTWLKVLFNKELKPNKKGTANAVHDREDAVAQREVYIHANKAREYNNLVWHHEELTAMEKHRPHLHSMALLSKDAECALRHVKLMPAATVNQCVELLHNIHCYELEGKQMVEYHVDFLEVGERQRLHPFWGGGVSKRIDMKQHLMEEYGQDESAFWQNNSRKCHWHERGKVRLTADEKRQGVVSHIAAVVSARHGAGGDMISEGTWERYERARKPYEPEFKNPFLVWARVGGDYGCWGGKKWRCNSGRCSSFWNGNGQQTNLRRS